MTPERVHIKEFHVHLNDDGTTEERSVYIFDCESALCRRNYEDRMHRAKL